MLAHYCGGCTGAIRVDKGMLLLASSTYDLDFGGGPHKIPFQGVTECSVCTAAGCFDVSTEGKVGFSVSDPPGGLVQSDCAAPFAITSITVGSSISQSLGPEPLPVFRTRRPVADRAGECVVYQLIQCISELVNVGG